jgi:hypothetical protein
MQDLILEIFADPAPRTPLFGYHLRGPWDMRGPSNAVPCAMEVGMTNAFSQVEIFVDAPEI